MPEMSGSLLDAAVQGLAVVGAVALLLTFFFGILVVKTASNSDAPNMSHELNRHFLIFSGVIVTIVGLASVGLPLLIAVGVGLLLMATAYRLLLPLLFILGGGSILFLILQALAR